MVNKKSALEDVLAFELWREPEQHRIYAIVRINNRVVHWRYIERDEQLLAGDGIKWLDLIQKDLNSRLPF